jgi:hypothetical protein
MEKWVEDEAGGCHRRKRGVNRNEVEIAEGKLEFES